MGAGRDLYGLRKDGTEIPVEIGLSPIETEGGVFVLASIVDITERKRLQQQRQVEAQNRELETLLHVTSHDLKEPLRSIETFSQMVFEEHAKALDEEAQDFLRRVVLAAARMRRLLDDILALSRARRVALPSEEIDLSSVVQDALARLEEQIKETGAAIRVSQSLPRFRVDRTWATQAVYNLISNALKFATKGRPPEIEIAPYASGGRAEGLVVRDRGPGVPPQHAERVFQLFQRAVGREVEGTGAGLAIVRAVAERHGGHAWVRPREGGGSEFIVTFNPAAPEKEGEGDLRHY